MISLMNPIITITKQQQNNRKTIAKKQKNYSKTIATLNATIFITILQNIYMKFIYTITSYYISLKIYFICSLINFIFDILADYYFSENDYLYA